MECEHCGQRDCHCVLVPISRRVGPVIRGPRLVDVVADQCVSELREIGERMRRETR